MGLKEDGTSKQIDIDKLNGLLRKIQTPIHLTFQRKRTKKASKDIPFISQFLLGVNNPGDVVVDIGQKVAKLPNMIVSPEVNTGFMIGDLIMASLEFIRVPVVYLVAYLMGQKIPSTRNNNARWLYSALLLGMGILAVTVPVTATVLGFVGAGLGLSVSLFLLGKAVWNRYKLSKEKNALGEQIIQEMRVMDEIQAQAIALENDLKMAKTREEKLALAYAISQLHLNFLLEKQKIDELKNKKLDIEEKIAGQNTLRIADRTLTVALSSLSVIGLALSLSMPGVGAAILLGVAVAGGTYVIGRMAYALGVWIHNKYTFHKERAARESRSGMTHESSNDLMIELEDFSSNTNKVDAKPEPTLEEPYTDSDNFFLSKLGFNKKRTENAAKGNEELGEKNAPLSEEVSPDPTLH